MRNGSPWSRLRRVFRQDPVAEIDDELQFHLEERARDYVAHGMEPEAARKAALERLGDLERVRNECTGSLAAERKAHARRVRLNVSWLDVKLGVRMLVKYPGLSLVAVLGMAVAIAIGAGYFGAFGAMLETTLPLEGGDRVVSIRNRDVTRPGNYRTSVHDFVRWREELTSVQELGAYREDSRNLITADGSTALVRVAEMTASGFQLTRISPMLGRRLLNEDERPGAPPVIVVGYEEWQRRFDGDPDILGRTVRLDGTVHTVVGVMPAGFGFPINHRYWAPLRLNVSDHEPGGGPSLRVFGRLTDGSTLSRAQAELATIGRRVAVAFPESHEHLRPQVLPYTHAIIGIGGPEEALGARAIQLVVSLLLVIVAVNVAILVYARTTTRMGEIAVRSALGASRRRVVAQLFVEALVLSVAASAIGLTIAGVALGMTSDFLRRSAELGGDGSLSGLPFWLDFGLSPGLIGYVVLLTVLAAAIVGVLPALKATGKRLQQGLQQFSSRGSAMRLGRAWTALIIVQVAVTVAALPAAVNFSEQSLRLGIRDPAAAANDLLRVTLVMPGAGERVGRDSAAYEQALHARFADRVTELLRRLEAEPEVSGVTFAQHFPGTEGWAKIEAEEAREIAADPAAEGQESGFFYPQPNHVAADLFDVFDVPILAGRGFVQADAREGATAVIVSETLAERIAGSANVVGRRIRYASEGDDDTEAKPWLEIVGVVPDFSDDFTTPNTFGDPDPRLYHAADVSHAHPLTLVVQIRGGSPARFAARLRETAANVDPTLRLERLQTVVGAWEHAQQAWWSTALGISAVMLSVLLLSAAGIYAMMSFTVARRRREIGIRSALGASPHRILTGIFARASAQLGTGVLAGLVFTAAFEWIGPGGLTGDSALILLPSVAALMVIVGLLAALGPARRGLAVQPTEALQEE